MKNITDFNISFVQGSVHKTDGRMMNYSQQWKWRRWNNNSFVKPPFNCLIFEVIEKMSPLPEPVVLRPSSRWSPEHIHPCTFISVLFYCLTKKKTGQKMERKKERKKKGFLLQYLQLISQISIPLTTEVSPAELQADVKAINCKSWTNSQVT